jgi:hypothetical protein
MGLSGSLIDNILTEYVTQDGIDDWREEVVSEILNCMGGYAHPSRIIELKEYNK